MPWNEQGCHKHIFFMNINKQEAIGDISFPSIIANIYSRFHCFVHSAGDFSPIFRHARKTGRIDVDKSQPTNVTFWTFLGHFSGLWLVDFDPFVLWSSKSGGVRHALKFLVFIFLSWLSLVLYKIAALPEVSCWVFCSDMRNRFSDCHFRFVHC